MGTLRGALRKTSPLESFGRAPHSRVLKLRYLAENAMICHKLKPDADPPAACAREGERGRSCQQGVGSVVGE